MIENEVKREEVPNASCHDCDTHLANVPGFATYKRDDESVYKCDKCYDSDPVLRRKCEIYSRVCGYLRPLEQWNVSKQKEFEDRKLFQVKEE